MVDVDLSDGLGAGARRRRSAMERRRVVEETFEAGASVARVALKHGVNANQVFQWRRSGHLLAAGLGQAQRTRSRDLPPARPRTHRRPLNQQDQRAPAVEPITAQSASRLITMYPHKRYVDT